MIQVDLVSLVVDSSGDPVVILKPISQDALETRLLPIWVGVQEAGAIVLAVQGETTSRPMAYDLMMKIIEEMGGSVVRVAVTRVEHGTFFAEVTLETPSGRRVIDARPSDSIALAMRAGAPMFVAADVLLEAGVVEEQDSEDGEESQIEAFNRFLDTVDPDDFRG